MKQPHVCPPVLTEVKRKPLNKVSSKSITSPIGFPQVPTTSGFELVKQNRFARIYKRNKEKVPPKIFFGFVDHFMKNVKDFKPLSTSITKWSNTLKQFVGKLPTNCLSVFDHFVGLALKRLTKFCKLIWLSFPN